MIVASNNPEDEGQYDFKLVASLPQYPAAAVYSEVITADILTVNIVNEGTAAWVLLPIFVILFFAIGVLLGIIFQRKRSGLDLNPFSKQDKIAHI